MCKKHFNNVAGWANISFTVKYFWLVVLSLSDPLQKKRQEKNLKIRGSSDKFVDSIHYFINLIFF